MTPTVTIVDYGSGNVFSVTRALEKCGARVNLTGDLEKIAAAGRLVLPGVGAFGAAMAALKERGLDDAVISFAATGRPFLGICVGKQAIMDVSEEFGRHEGLKLIPGLVLPISATGVDGIPHPVPHTGWNRLVPEPRDVDAAAAAVLASPPAPVAADPFGDGRAGERIAEILATRSSAPAGAPGPRESR